LHLGTSVSGSFLFLVGVANTIAVVRLLRRRRAVSNDGPFRTAA
jgi:high-affinity nickel permease